MTSAHKADTECTHLLVLSTGVFKSVEQIIIKFQELYIYKLSPFTALRFRNHHHHVGGGACRLPWF